MRGRLLGHALGLAAAILLAGCAGLPLSPQLPQTPAQLARGAFASWGKAAALRLTGNEQLPNEGMLRFTVTDSADGRQGQATGTLDGKPFSYLATSGKQYLRGQSFWQQYSHNGQQDQPDATLAKGFEDKYVRVGVADAPAGLDSGNEVTSSLTEAPRLLGAVTDLKVDAGALWKGNGTRIIGGRRAAPLMFGVNTPFDSFTETFWIAQGNPDQLVGYSGRTRDVYSEPFDVTIGPTRVPHHPRAPAPAERVNYPADPSTIPAFYAVEGDPASGSWLWGGGTSLGDCDQNSCQLQASIQNQGGAPQGMGKVAISVQPVQDGSTSSATCTADIPTIASNQNSTVSCKVSGAAWNSVVNEATNPPFLGPVPLNDNLALYAKITDNPPYVGSS